MSKKLKIALNLHQLSTNELVGFGGLIVGKMKNNSNFPNQLSLVGRLEIEIDSLDDLIKRQESAYKTYQELGVLVTNKKQEIKNTLSTLASEVENIAHDDEAKIINAGFRIKNINTTSSEISTPQNLSLSEAGGTGKLTAQVSAVKGAKSYIFEINYDINNPTGWVKHLITTKSKNVLTNLTAGKQIWVRVSALGSTGESSYSDIATRIVP